MTDQEIVEKTIARINKSTHFYKTFSPSFIQASITTYSFDDNLQVDAYNGLYRIVLNGEKLTHIHGKVDGLKDLLSKTIRAKQDERKQDALNAL